MADNQDINLGEALKALANPVRRQVVKTLLDTPGGMTENCAIFDVPVSKSTLTQHMNVLDEAGIVERVDFGNRCEITLRSTALDQHLPGLLDLIRDEQAVAASR